MLGLVIAMAGPFAAISSGAYMSSSSSEVAESVTRSGSSSKRLTWGAESWVAGSVVGGGVGSWVATDVDCCWWALANGAVGRMEGNERIDEVEFVDCCGDGVASS